MLNRSWKIVLWVIIGLAFIVGGLVFYQRCSVEADNKKIEVAMQWDIFLSGADKQEISEKEATAMAKGSINSFIFKEMTMDDIINQNIGVDITSIELRTAMNTGEVVVTDENNTILQGENISLDSKYLWLSDETYASSIINSFKIKTSISYKEYTINSLGKSHLLLQYEDDNAELKDLGLAFDIEAMKRVNEAGFYAIPRFTTWSNYEFGDMEALATPLKDVKCGAIMFNDKNVVNSQHDDDIEKVYKDMTKGLKLLDAPLVMAEFYNQKGLGALVKAYDYNMVRLHSIADNEINGTVTPEIAFDRYKLSVNERNIRILFLKPFPGKDFIGMVEYAEKLTDRLESRGFVLDKAEALPVIPVATWYLMFISLGIGAGSILLGNRFSLLKLSFFLSGLMIAGCWGLALAGNQLLAARVLGLMSAIVFPTLALVTFVGDKRNLLQTLVTLLKITGITLIGAVYIVALFPFQGYMNSIDIFSGVKIGMLMPLLLFFIYCLFLKEKTDIFKKSQLLAKSTVNYGQLAILGILAVAFLLLMLRSGNDGVTVSSLEIAFRTKLEQLMVVRPRTKEFLIGIPALTLALYFGYKDYLLPLWLIGAIGQVSILNTFCHFHTPLLISLFRTFNGIWSGIVLGLIAIGVVILLMKKYKKRMEGNTL